MTIRLTAQQKIKVLNVIDLAKIMQDILLREKRIDRNKEHCWIVCLDNSNRILMIELISLGSVNETIIEPVEVFSFALQKGAVKIILVHNHPSGSLIPSEQDVELTDRMTAIGKFLRLQVIDHLIISEDLHYSFAESGKLKEIIKSSTYDLTFKDAERISATKSKALKEEGKLETAKAMKKKGYSIEEITELTGLTKEQIRDLATTNKLQTLKKAR